ncbi:MAG: hypothetical protein K2I96_21320 [Lachnospiraceae bacterium]|nr:hypothetical protein [Lachnospiraceae bacterium]
MDKNMKLVMAEFSIDRRVSDPENAVEGFGNWQSRGRQNRPALLGEG